MEKWVIYRVSYKGSVRPALLVWQIYSVVFDVKKTAPGHLASQTCLQIKTDINNDIIMLDWLIIL